MTAEDIAYVEICTADRAAAMEYFIDSFGLTPLAETADSQSVSTLLGGAGHLLVTTPTTPGPLAEHLERHGDGVFDVAFRTSDVEGTVERAERAGLRRLGRRDGFHVLDGFGTIRHTLVPAARTGTDGLPGSWRRTGRQVSGPGSTLDHLAGVVPAGELQSTVDTYCAAFGMHRYSAEHVEVGAQAMDSVVIRSDGDITFTMIEPDADREAGQIDAFLRGNGGGGIQHLALLVDDIILAVREMSARGVAFLEAPDEYYNALGARVGRLDERLDDLRATNVLADRDEWGYLLQIFTRSPYPRSTLFYELIQRNEARGFGIANIRALYESVERSMAEATRR